MEIKTEFLKLLKFNIVGIMNTIIDFTVFSVLTGIFLLPILPSQVVSYSCGIINSYLWNRFWTFKAKGKRTVAEMIKFVVINLIMLGISTLLLYYLLKIISNVYLTKLIVIGIVMVLNFLTQRLIIFKAVNSQL